jgi:hypothetical protein
LLNITKAAPSGHIYLQVKRLISIEDIRKINPTIPNKGVFNWKAKMARAGQIL